MKITSSLFEAVLKCPTKCYLRSRDEPGSGNEVADWLQAQTTAYHAEGVERLRQGIPQDQFLTCPSPNDLRHAKWRLAIDVLVQTDRVESRIQALQRVPGAQDRPAQIVPIRFHPANKLAREEKLLLGFDALAVSGALGRKVSIGRIVHGDEQTALRANTSSLAAEARRMIEKAATLISHTSPPDLVLNRHCSECEFQVRCKQLSIERDDLSLLANMKDKERKKLNSEGIFTVTQLSYTFRPRRRPKRLKNQREKYHHALKALAIREQKVHIVGRPDFKIDGTPVYLDVEGLPDRELYYLIGLRAKTGDTVIQHSLWADEAADERKAWNAFLDALAAIERPFLVHYGSFETTFLRRMCERYGGPPADSPAGRAIKSAINLLSVIFAQIYFPTYSNGLKDLATWLGHKWSVPYPSGLRSIIWRMAWEASRDPVAKESVILYNSEDCQALEVLTGFLSRLCEPGHRAALENGTDAAAVLAEESTTRATLWGSFSSTVEGFEAINKAARWDVQRDKVYIRTDELLSRISRTRVATERRATYVNKEVLYERSAICPACGQRPGFRGLGRKTVYDVRFSRYGIRRWAVTYHYSTYWCPRCHKMLGTPAELKPWGLYGRKLTMYAVYKAIDLCMPQHSIAQELNRLFKLGLQEGTVHRLKALAAEHYKETRARILERLINGSVIHADETPIVLKHKRGCVWVFASFREVVYFYTETREGAFVERTLKEFSGVLVSDFYAPYDSLCCPQQKCLIHLIRDLNDEVLGHPYDTELKEMVTGFADLLRAIVQTVDRWGLKRRYLAKHKVGVERFYRKMTKTAYHSEAALKVKERFEKNRDGLFTFLNYDGIPWNNNNAEHAVKAFVLSICQTCKYSGLDFLDFLLSGERDVDVYARTRVTRRRVRPERPC